LQNEIAGDELNDEKDQRIVHEANALQTRMNKIDYGTYLYAYRMSFLRLSSLPPPSR